ncbi:MAG: carboxymuconolactone decarboxylase family protein [Acidimicrobiia bacterium]|nr:carboxymuconolactone decarboxylase family protein [Acidimicrobiia bacterium]
MAVEPGGYRDRLRRNAAAGRKLADHQPELHTSYWRTHELAMADGALDRKTKELIGLSLVVAMQCDVCIAFHVRDCLNVGATKEEIYEALNVTVMQGSGPAMVYAGYAVEALDEYLAGRQPTGDGPAPHRH